MARTKKKDPQSYSAGEKGRNRVRVFPDPKTGIHQIEWREHGKRRTKSLKHRDWDKAKAQADDFAANYVEPDPEAEAEPEPLTLGQLFEMYLEEVTPTKSTGVQKFDRAAAKRLLQSLGSEALPSRLTRTEWDLFIRQRSSGKITGHKVGPRTVARDLKFLHAVLNWATLSTDGDGGLLMDRNPLRGLPMPAERNPKRPMVSDAEYQALLDVADEIDPMLRTLFIVASETGHRIGAVRQLRWSDVDLRAKSIRWRAECDKLGHEHVTPLTEAARNALEARRRDAPGIGNSYVFGAPQDPSKPVSRHLVRDWWRKAEELAGLERIEGRGWHSLRRKFASDLMEMPLKVLCQLGGWNGTDTVVECYQHADQERLREALAARRKGRTGS